MWNVPGGQYSRVVMQGTVDVSGVITGSATNGNGTVMEVTDRANGGYTFHRVQITGVNGDTITFEGNVDGTNWVALLYTNATSGSSATTATADGIYYSTAPVLGLTEIRARLTRVNGTVIVSGVLVA